MQCHTFVSDGSFHFLDTWLFKASGLRSNMCRTPGELHILHRRLPTANACFYYHGLVQKEFQNSGLHVSRLAISDYECALRFVQVFASTWQCAQLWQRRLGPVALLDRLPTQDDITETVSRYVSSRKEGRHQ